jgi:WD40 repeat protein
MEVTFSPDEKLLAAGTLEGDMLLWDVETHEQLLRCTGPTDSMVAIRFSPDGRYLAGVGWDSTIWLWGIPEPAPEPEPPPSVPEASTLLLLGAGASALLTYVGLQAGFRRTQEDTDGGE